ncbi:MAG: YbjQ family protein [Planctomycetota bacterium]|nr:YbjQ family protein [Planctomycetota bacterium]
MIVTTCDTVPGRELQSTLGLCRGSAIRARHLGKDILASLKNIVGGEMHEYSKLLAETREQALDRMIEDARSKGADAVVAVRYASTSITQGAAEFLAYGTAVKLT